ncbi:MAG: DUF177 domain-containing protein [Minwuia sp.]|nr:DUF177 domain-containing protein [Minwuia sp.]
MQADESPDDLPVAPPLYSYWVDVSDLSDTGRQLVLTLDEPTRATLAEAFDLIDLPMVTVRADLQPRGAGVTLQFHLTAQVVQPCVVTLEPVAGDVDEMVTLHYTPRAVLGETSRIVDIADEEDPPEPLDGDRLDLGAAVAEHLALSLDPFPRKANAELPSSALDGQHAATGPFAALAKLKREET